MAKANNLEYSKIFQPALDKQIVQTSTTGWMELNDSLVRYNGGSEVKVPSLVMDGLGDYDRASGFVDGSVTLTWSTYALTQDRGRTFSLDSQDVDETNFVATAGTVLGEFQRQHVAPEIDAYRYSTLAALAIANENGSRELDVTRENIVDELLADLALVEDKVGAQDIVITLNPVLASYIGVAGKDYLGKGQLQKGEIYTNVNTFNDAAIVKARSGLLKTAFVFADGTTGGQEVGGFVADDAAQDVNWIISARTAPIAISKTDKVRTFTPDVNQNADAWKVDYRKYHDLWVLDNQLDRVFVNVKPAAV